MLFVNRIKLLKQGVISSTREAENEKNITYHEDAVTVLYPMIKLLIKLKLTPNINLWLILEVPYAELSNDSTLLTLTINFSELF